MNRGNIKYAIYTNNHGRAVFILKKLFDDFNVSDSNGYIGEPLHMILGIDYDITDTWLNKREPFGNVDIEIKPFGGAEAVKALLQFSPTFDHKGNFKGSDIMIEIIDNDQSSEVVGVGEFSSVGQKEDEATHENEILAMYFIEKMTALRVLMLRMAGLKLGKAIDKVFDQFSKKNSLEIRSYGGYIDLEDAKKLTLAEINNLLSHIAGYVVGITSLELVNKALDEFENKQTSQVLEVVNK